MGDQHLPQGFGSWHRVIRYNYVSQLANATSGPKRPFFESGDLRVIPALADVVFHDPDVKVRQIALGGLMRRPDPACVPALMHGLESTDRVSRDRAMRGLARLKAREAVPLLIELLKDREWTVKAASALVTIRDVRALGPMREAAADAWPLRRRRLRKRIKRLEEATGTGG